MVEKPGNTQPNNPGTSDGIASHRRIELTTNLNIPNPPIQDMVRMGGFTLEATKLLSSHDWLYVRVLVNLRCTSRLHQDVQQFLAQGITPASLYLCILYGW